MDVTQPARYSGAVATTLDVLVVGAGPAGLTAGIYLRRFQRTIAIADAGRSRARLIPLSRNYPGFPEGIAGEALLRRLRTQLAAVDGTVLDGTVEGLVREDGGFVARLDGGTVRARAVLLATGVVDREPALPGIAALRERGLLRQCPICDGYEFAGRRIGVIGGDAHAMRVALFLSDYSESLTLFSIDGRCRLSDADVETLQRRHVRCIFGHAVEVAEGEQGCVLVRLANGTAHRFDVLYAALGSEPRSELATALGARLDDAGNVAVDAHCRTSVAGLYAAGDVVSALDQIAVATGHAAIAATAIHNALRTTGADFTTTSGGR